MITGMVNADLQALIQVAVRSPRNQEQAFHGIVDTGFNGYLTLPPAVIAALGLRQIGWGRVTVATGAEELFELYQAEVICEGRPITVEVDAAETDCLVGMSLLSGHELRLKIVDGGSVTIEPLA